MKTIIVLIGSNDMASPATRKRILEVGRSLLLEDGLRSITTHAVAAQARISKKILYSIFPSKDDLVEAVVLSFIEENLLGLGAILDQPDPAIVRIRRALAFISAFMPQVQNHVIARIERFDPQLWAKIDNLRMMRLKRLAMLIAARRGSRWPACRPCIER